jgi:hypothetical protein
MTETGDKRQAFGRADPEGAARGLQRAKGLDRAYLEKRVYSARNAFSRLRQLDGHHVPDQHDEP